MQAAENQGEQTTYQTFMHMDIQKAYGSILKCSSLGVTPCTSCVRRGRPDDCRWENLPETAQYAIEIRARFLPHQTNSHADFLTGTLHFCLKLIHCELKSKTCIKSYMGTLLIMPLKRATVPVDLLRCVHPAQSRLSQQLQQQHTQAVRDMIQFRRLNTLVLATDS